MAASGGLPGRAGAAARGKHSTNSVPAPGPALATEMRPPCNCTRRRTTASPMPRPLPGWVSGRRICVKRSNTCGRSALAMPMPLSRTRQFQLIVAAAQCHLDSTAGLGVLDGIVEQVTDDLVQPGLVADDPRGRHDVYVDLTRQLRELHAAALRLRDARAGTCQRARGAVRSRPSSPGSCPGVRPATDPSVPFAVQ